MNGEGQRPVVDELFNFFVRVSKVKHLAHVVVATSDTFFIEEVYRSSALEKCARYKLVDYFDKGTVKGILAGEGFSGEEAEYVWEWVGGVPWYLVEVIEARRMGRLREAVEELYRAVLGRIREFLATEYERDADFERRIEEYLKELVKEGRLFLRKGDRKAVSRLVEKEIVFYDPVTGEVRPHSSLEERAIREVLLVS